MTTASPINGTQLLVFTGNGGDPETFSLDCLVNAERGIVFSSDANDEIEPDCDDLDAPGWKITQKDGLSASISGAGILHSTSVEAWDAWMTGGDIRGCRIRVNTSADAGGGFWAGEFSLTQFEVSGNRNDKATASITLTSVGAVAWRYLASLKFNNKRNSQYVGQVI